MIMMSCASTKIVERTLDKDNKMVAGVLKAAKSEDVDPFLNNFCAGKYEITAQKVKTETEGFIFKYNWGYKYVDFRCKI